MKPTNSKEILLACALRLFSEKGYDNTGVNEIVQAAGVTKPTLYYFFGSKEGLFEAILAQYYGRLNAILAEASTYVPHADSYQNDVLPTLLRIADAYYAYAQENKPFYLMLLSLSVAPPTAPAAGMVAPYNIAQYQAIIRCFEHIAQTHYNLKGKERQCAYHFIALINANIGLWHYGYVKLDAQSARHVVQQFMHGIFS